METSRVIPVSVFNPGIELRSFSNLIGLVAGLAKSWNSRFKPTKFSSGTPNSFVSTLSEKEPSMRIVSAGCSSTFIKYSIPSTRPVLWAWSPSYTFCNNTSEFTVNLMVEVLWFA